MPAPVAFTRYISSGLSGLAVGIERWAYRPPDRNIQRRPHRVPVQHIAIGFTSTLCAEQLLMLIRAGCSCTSTRAECPDSTQLSVPPKSPKPVAPVL